MLKIETSKKKVKNTHYYFLVFVPKNRLNMEQVNRLGGIVAADLIAISGVSSVSTSSGYPVAVTTQSGSSWLELPLSLLQSSVQDSVDDGDAGKLKVTNATLNLCDITPEMKSYIDAATIQGCILRVHYANGDTIHYGTKLWPMSGFLIRVSGQATSDGHLYRLTLTSSIPYQGLQ